MLRPITWEEIRDDREIQRNKILCDYNYIEGEYSYYLKKEIFEWTVLRQNTSSHGHEITRVGSDLVNGMLVMAKLTGAVVRDYTL